MKYKLLLLKINSTIILYTIVEYAVDIVSSLNSPFFPVSYILVWTFDMTLCWIME